MTDRIEKQIDLNAPLERAWRALTDHREFGRWFGVSLEGPFVPGEVSRGRVTHPGYEHVVWQARIKAIVPQTLFSFTWHPYGLDKEVDYSKETPTLVEFRLEPTAGGTRTRLHLTESGFEGVPAERRAEAFRMNESGWTQQMKNVEAHLAAAG